MGRFTQRIEVSNHFFQVLTEDIVLFILVGLVVLKILSVMSNK